MSSVTLGTNMSTGILCQQEYYVTRNIRNIMSSGISRILCHQEYQEYYVIRNSMSSVTFGTNMSTGNRNIKNIMSSGTSRILCHQEY